MLEGRLKSLLFLIKDVMHFTILHHCKSVPITTKVVSLNPVHGEVYLRQFGGCLGYILRFSLSFTGDCVSFESKLLFHWLGLSQRYSFNIGVDI
jgi:hypothetical protein